MSTPMSVINYACTENIGTKKSNNTPLKLASTRLHLLTCRVMHFRIHVSMSLKLGSTHRGFDHHGTDE